MTNNETAEAVQFARSVLLQDLPYGSIATTAVTHVTKSGMSRSIRVLVGQADGSVSDLSWAVARVLGWKFDQVHGGVKVNGTGMDMAFHLVYTLSLNLHSESLAISQTSL